MCLKGAFTARGIAPGNYKVFVVGNITAARLQNPEEYAKLESEGSAVTVAPSATATADITLR